MRRKEKEITARDEIEAIIRQAKVCRVAFCNENTPYVVPLCFGYQDDALYFHSAREGKKLDILRKNNRVCFEFDIGAELQLAPSACAWGMAYKSVIGFGRAVILEDSEQKRRALDVIMRQYAGGGPFTYTDDVLGEVAVVKVAINSMTGKQAG